MNIIAFLKEIIGLDPGPDFEKCQGDCLRTYCERRSKFGEPQTPECQKAHDEFLRRRKGEIFAQRL